MRLSGDRFRTAAMWLSAARRPLVLLGPESASDIECSRAIADALGAAVLTTPDAKALIPEPRSSGVFSFGASALAAELAARADLVLAVCSLSEFTCKLGAAFRDAVVVHVSDRPEHIGRNLTPAIALVGSIPEIGHKLRAALEEIEPTPRPRWDIPIAAAMKPPAPPPARPHVIHPAAGIDAIQSVLPDDVQVCLDITSGSLHASERFQLSPPQRVFYSVEQSASMGEALLASIGVRLASERPTLVIVGDWTFCMTPAEIHTAVELGLGRYVVVVWANGGGALVRAGAELQGFRVPKTTYEWQNRPRFADVAAAYGALSCTVTDAPSLAEAVARGFLASRPMLIEAHIDPEAEVPAGDRFRVLGNARSAAATSAGGEE